MKNESVKKIIPWLAGFLLAVAVTAVSVAAADHGTRTGTGHHVVIFGDSIIAYKQNAEDVTTVTNMIINETGMDVLDLSFGGTQMADSYDMKTLGNTRNYLSMYSLAQAFYTGDFSLQENYVTHEPGTDYFEERIGEMVSLDLTKTDIVIIEQCLNDYHCGIPIGTPDDNEYTYCGALASAIRYLKEVNPDLRIIIMSPAYKWLNGGPSGEEYDYGGGTLDRYVEAGRQTAEEMGVEYLSLFDVYDQEYVTSEGEVITGYAFTVDGTHPNYYGRQVISRRIAEYLRETENDGN